MWDSSSRRSFLSALTAGSTAAIAGCGSDESLDDEGPREDHNTEQTDIKERDQEPGKNKHTEQPEFDDHDEEENVLFVPSGEEYTLEESEQYTGVEIEPTGAVLFESISSLELNDDVKT